MIKSHQNWLIAGFFFLFNIILKMSVADEMSIWRDESFSIFNAQQSLSNLWAILAEDTNPPLYFLILHYWIQAFGIDVFAVKSLSIIFSGFTALVIYFLGIRIQGRFTAILVSCFFLLSNIHFDFSHEVRAFSMVTFLSVTSFLIFFKLLKKFSIGYLILLVIVNAALPATHYISVMVPIVQFATIWLYRKSCPKFWFVVGSYFLSALIFIPQLLIALNNAPDESFWMETPDFDDFRYVVYKLMGHDRGFLFLFIPICLFPLLLIFNRKWGFFNRELDQKTAITILLWYAMPIISCFLIAQFTPIFHERYLLFSSIGAFFSFGYLLSMLKLKPFLKYGIFAFFILLFLKEFKPQDRNFEQWDRLADLLLEYHQENSATIISTGYKIFDLGYYYDREAFADHENFLNRMAEHVIIPVTIGEELERWTDLMSYSRINLILSHNAITDPEHTVEQYFDDSELIKCDDMGDSYSARLLVYQSPEMPCFDLREIAAEPVEIYCFNWLKTTSENKINGRMVIDYTIDMNQSSGCKENHIGEFDTQDSLYQFSVSSEFPYSPTFLIPIDGIDKLTFSADVVSSESTPARFVVTIENFWNTFHREEFLLKNEPFRDGVYQLEHSTKIDEYDGDDVEARIYLWNPDTEPVLLRSFKIRSFEKPVK